MKAVIWTDVFQTFIMLAGMLAVVIQVSTMSSQSLHLFPQRGETNCYIFLQCFDCCSFGCTRSPACSLHFPSFTTVLMPLFTQSFHFKHDLRLLRRPRCFSASAIFSSRPSPIYTKCPIHVILLFADLRVRFFAQQTPLSGHLSSLYPRRSLCMCNSPVTSRTCSFCCCCCYVGATISKSHLGICRRYARAHDFPRQLH